VGTQPTRHIRAHIGVFVAYGLIALLITYPLVLNIATQFAGFDYGDAYENAHHLWWFGYALQNGEPLFFQTLLGYPNGIDGVTLQANLLQFFPSSVFALFMPVAAAYNLQILLTLALNGWAMYWLVRSQTENMPAAFVSGVVFMAFPTMQGHLGAGHAGLMVQWTVPLYVWALYALRVQHAAMRSKLPLRAMLAVGLCIIATAFGHTLQIIYVLLPITAWFTLSLLWQRDWRTLRAVVIVNALALGLLALYLLPTLQAATGSAYADEGGAVRYSADLLAAVTPSFFHPLYGQLAYTRQVLGVNLDEGAAYIGLIAGALALLGVWRKRDARAWLWLALVSYVLALGPLLKLFDQPVAYTVDGYSSFITLPYASLQELPLFNLARTPGRFNYVLALAVAMMAGYGLAWLVERAFGGKARFAWVMAVLCAGLIVADYQMFFPLPTAPADIPQPIADLRQREDIRAVMDVPWDNLIVAKTGLYLQTAHQQALLAGQVTRRTPVDPAMLTLLEQTLDLHQLDAAGVDVIILHRQHAATDLETRLRSRMGAPTYEDDRFIVFEVPLAENQPSPESIASMPAQDILTDQAVAYLYMPSRGWRMWALTLQGSNRSIRVSLNGETLWHGTIDDTQTINVPLPLAEAGYHTAVLALDPPCPPRIPAPLACDAVQVQSAAFSPLALDDLRTPITFEQGVTLHGAFAEGSAQVGEALPIWLWWSFAQGRTTNDVRFVHLINEAGELVAQVDSAVGEQPLDSQWAESMLLEIPRDLAAGEYQLYVGWYTFPEITPLLTQSDDPRAQGGRVHLGQVTLLAE
jgi:hypothetical protein